MPSLCISQWDVTPFIHPLDSRSPVSFMECLIVNEFCYCVLQLSTLPVARTLVLKKAHGGVLVRNFVGVFWKGKSLCQVLYFMDFCMSCELFVWCCVSWDSTIDGQLVWIGKLSLWRKLNIIHEISESPDLSLNGWCCEWSVFADCLYSCIIEWLEILQGWWVVTGETWQRPQLLMKRSFGRHCLSGYWCFESIPILVNSIQENYECFSLFSFLLSPISSGFWDLFF